MNYEIHTGKKKPSKITDLLENFLTVGFYQDLQKLQKEFNIPQSKPKDNVVGLAGIVANVNLPVLVDFESKKDNNDIEWATQ